MSDYFLADDLSGALDAAAAFHQAGRRVTIALSAERWPHVGTDDVVGITTETRNASPAEAARVVRSVIEEGRARGARLVYKKIDSTLRGPIAAELTALAAAMPEAKFLFTPANPRVGRTVREGVLWVHGVPVAETDFARDPVCPVHESSIRRLLGRAATARVEIADATTEEELSAAVERMAAAGGIWVPIGSGALARPVAALVTGGRRKVANDGGQKPGDASAATGNSSDSPPWDPGACLMVCGSAHPGNRVQAAVLARERDVLVHELCVAGPAGVVEAALADFRAGRGSAIVIEERRGDSVAIINLIAGSVARIQAETKMRRVFVTGGETAFALCNALEISTLTFREEIEAGLSLSRGENARGGVMFAIKPGGFGDTHAWVRAWDALVAG